MSETANYHLPLTDDSSTKFLDWREAINGVSDSAMVRIDTALSEKANNSAPVYSTLLADAWDGTEAPYTQTITVEGISAATNGHVGLAQDATTAQRKAARDAILAVTGQSDSTLTITADGDEPSCDIPIVIILLG